MTMKIILKFVVSWLALLAVVAVAEEKLADTEVKKLSGISIIGNKEAPKSLYIVPWQNAEVGKNTHLHSGALGIRMQSLDKEVFFRELNFYEVSHGIK